MVNRLTVNSPIFFVYTPIRGCFLTVWLKRLKAQKLLAQGVWGFAFCFYGVWGIAFFPFKNYLKIRVVSLSLSNSS